MPHRPARFLAVAATAFLLSGCFMSQAPKFPMTSAVPAFGEGGRYQAFERVEGDRYEKDKIIVISRRADGGYDFADEKGEVQPISLHPIGAGLLVGQAKPEPNRNVHAYVVFRSLGNEMFIHVPQCGNQDKAKLQALGVEFVGQYECLIDRVADPAALFASLALGQPASKLVRE